MKRFKKLLAESAKKVENSKMTTETWGNISIRDPETGYVFLSPAGIRLRHTFNQTAKQSGKICVPVSLLDQ